MAVKGPPQLVPSADTLAIAQRNQQQSLLLRLPAELRTRIYEFVMDTRSTGVLHHDHYEWDRLDFSRACRQIFAETARVYLDKKLLPLSNDNGISCKNLQQWQTALEELTPAQKGGIKLVGVPFLKAIEIIDSRTWPDLWTKPHLPVLAVFLPKLRQYSDTEVRTLEDYYQSFDTTVRIQLVRQLHGALELS